MIDYDVVRQFAIMAAVVLALLLMLEFAFLALRKPWAIEVMVCRLVIFFFNLGAGYTSYLRLGEPGDGMVFIRLTGHTLGILLIVIAWSIRRDHRARESS